MNTNVVGGDGGRQSGPVPVTGPQEAQTGPLGGVPRVKGAAAGVPGEVSEAAAAMGRRSAGKPKALTDEQREKLREHMGKVNELRRDRFKVASGKRVLKAARDEPAGTALATGRLVKRTSETPGAVVASGRLVRKTGTVTATGVARPKFTTATIYAGS